MAKTSLKSLLLLVACALFVTEGNAECPMFKCVAGCNTYAKDENGCQTCDCADLCKGIVCGEGRVCKEIRIEANFSYVPVCVKERCATAMCANSCVFGFKETGEGCISCQCTEKETHLIIACSVVGVVMLVVAGIVVLYVLRSRKTKKMNINDTEKKPIEDNPGV